MGEFTNLNKHLLKHSITRGWYNDFNNYKKKGEDSLTDNVLNFVKFFISSYQSFTLIQN